MEKKLQWDKINGDPRIDAYKWEFLRRNEEFQEHYAAFAHQFPEWITEYGGLITPARVDQRKRLPFFDAPVRAAAHAITNRWWVVNPVHPGLSSIPSQLPRDVDPPFFRKANEVEG